MAINDISLSSSMRSNLLSLKETSDLLSRTQERLSTGKKVNSAMDNPSSYFTAQTLNNRAGDLNNLLDSMGQAVQTLTTADQGITALTSLVEQASSIIEQAATVSIVPTTATGILYDAGSANKLEFDGTEATADNDSFYINISDTNTDPATTVTIGFNANIVATDTADLDAVIKAFNESDNAVKYGVTAEIVDGEIAIKNESGLAITGGAISGNFVTTASGGDGDHVGWPDKDGAEQTAPSATATKNERDEYQKQYNLILEQIDKLVQDTSYKGVNLLNGDSLTVNFNETRTSFLDIKGIVRDSATLGLKEIENPNTMVKKSLDTLLTDIDTAINTLRKDASTFGQNLSIVETRQDFTENMINILTTGADNLTLADMNEESANMLALQTRQSLGTNALSMAAQADQSVLKLFT